MDRMLTQNLAKPEGGYRLIPVAQLFMVWWCYRQGHICLLDLRLWFALHEMASRRCHATKSDLRQFRVDELADLTGRRGERVLRVGLDRLERCGLAKARRTVIVFGRPKELTVGDLSELWSKLEEIPNRRRKVPVPRRMVRFIAKCGRPVLIATVLGHLFRMLYFRSGACRPDGACKASWVAKAFQVDIRNVKAARRSLIDMGWLSAEETPQWHRNRYGWRGRIELAWAVDKPKLADPKSPPRRQVASCKTPPPVTNKKLFSRNNINEPAIRGAFGVCKRNCRSSRKRRTWLGTVTTEQIVIDEKTRELFLRAVRKGLVARSESGLLQVFAAAEHSRRVATRNVAGMFVWLVTRQKWEHLSQEDENAARLRVQRLKDGRLTSKLGVGEQRRRLQTPTEPMRKPVTTDQVVWGLLERLTQSGGANKSQPPDGRQRAASKPRPIVAPYNRE